MHELCTKSNLAKSLNLLFFCFRILMTEMKNSDLLPYYGDIGDAGIGKIAQMPLNFNLAKDNFDQNNLAKNVSNENN